MAGVRRTSGRVIAFDRSRGRGIVELDGRAVVIDASQVDASHLLAGDAVALELDGERIVAVRFESAAPPSLANDTRGLFVALLDAQDGAPYELLATLAGRDDLAPFVRAWLGRWDRPIRFWEPANVAAVVDRRLGDRPLTEVLVVAQAEAGPGERAAWLAARMKLR